MRGELDLNTASRLEGPLQEAISGGSDLSVLLDLSDCEFIDSTGIALVVRAWHQVDRNADGGGQGQFVLCCSNDQVERLLKITGVDSSISTHRQREAALSELNG